MSNLIKKECVVSKRTQEEQLAYRRKHMEEIAQTKKENPHERNREKAYELGYDSLVYDAIS